MPMSRAPAGRAGPRSRRSPGEPDLAADQRQEPGHGVQQRRLARPDGPSSATTSPGCTRRSMPADATGPRTRPSRSRSTSASSSTQRPAPAVGADLDRGRSRRTAHHSGSAGTTSSTVSSDRQRGGRPDLAQLLAVEDDDRERLAPRAVQQARHRDLVQGREEARAARRRSGPARVAAAPTVRTAVEQGWRRWPGRPAAQRAASGRARRRSGGARTPRASRGTPAG